MNLSRHVERPFRNQNSGFSLAEVVIALSIFTITVLVLHGSISLAKLAFYNQVDRSKAEQNVKHTLEIMARDLREAKQGMNPITCTTADYDNPQNICIKTSSSSAVLSFKVPESTNHDTENTSYKTIRYDWTTSWGPYRRTIRRTEISSIGAASAPVIIGRDITAVSFSHSTNTIRLNLTSQNYTHSMNSSQSMMVYLRNNT
ncbi:MAG: hypothetical protein COV74_04385 [Candidatus Omnitrophica bacterium CG11_big_fil_rev_8_21_14_0_20_45_26]|uniref:Prepilin-type N-terminal cleavage/methylation domain-containing protein n=1 Tax=Candidatus Abzuiibacterium crystallinum TaxID=1974748 RepID=A0A2H0LQ25_9BACT|nr:MAG: hypothetical protein COV74_04385 [Candidatus Omnitrophica bacterium CG11_big_fil_rev_8_21_14_0_20_45_26]PIW64267.1 MAG: hypothetical protein COW12_06905 [Candidatus Omnitrophica bacterium CG12_big_fil_rev_8_21_14_0_65_45_16]